MPCKHILTDYRWAMEIQPYLEGIVLESEAQATTQMLSCHLKDHLCYL